jgi:hypothetical protein
MLQFYDGQYMYYLDQDCKDHVIGKTSYLKFSLAQYNVSPVDGAVVFFLGCKISLIFQPIRIVLCKTI